MRRFWLKFLALTGWAMAAVFIWLFFRWPSPAATELQDEMRAMLVQANQLKEMEHALTAISRKEAETAASLLRSDTELATLKSQQTAAKLAEQAAIAEAHRLRADIERLQTLSDEHWAEVKRLRRELVATTSSIARTDSTPQNISPVPIVEIAPVPQDTARLLSLSTDGGVCALGVGHPHNFRTGESVALTAPTGKLTLLEVTDTYPDFFLARIVSATDLSQELQRGQNYPIYRP